jgi:hypothetical protein
MLVQQLTPGQWVYITEARSSLKPIGRLRVVQIKGAHVVVALEGDESQFGVYRDHVLERILGPEQFQHIQAHFDAKSPGDLSPA